jgi:hypothetical protein
LHQKFGGAPSCCQTTPKFFLHPALALPVTDMFLHFAPLLLDTSKFIKIKIKCRKFVVSEIKYS